MKSLTIALALAAASIAAHAEWQPIFQDGSGSQVVYIDISTLRAKDGLTRVWTMTDFHTSKSVSGLTFRSDKTLREFNCQTSEARRAMVVLYAESKGNGKVVYTFDKASDWAPIVPETMMSAIEEIACAKPTR